MRTQTQFAVPDPGVPSPLRALHSLREKHVRMLAGTLTQLPGCVFRRCRPGIPTLIRASF